MAAPVRNSVELDAVGELHLVLRLEPAALLVSLLSSAGVAVVGVSSGKYTAVVDELNVVGAGVGVYGRGRVAAGITGCDPSSLARAAGRGARWVAAVVMCRAGARRRGGILGARRVANGEGCEMVDGGEAVSGRRKEAFVLELEGCVVYHGTGLLAGDNCGQPDGAGVSL